MGEVLLIGENWRFRALVRAQLLEEGYDVTALPSLDAAMSFLRGGGRLPRVTVFDGQGLGAAEVELVDLRHMTGKAPILHCAGLLSRYALAQEDSIAEKVLFRPFSIGNVIDEVQKLISCSQDVGKAGVQLVPADPTPLPR